MSSALSNSNVQTGFLFPIRYDGKPLTDQDIEIMKKNGTIALLGKAWKLQIEINECNERAAKFTSEAKELKNEAKELETEGKALLASAAQKKMLAVMLKSSGQQKIASGQKMINDAQAKQKKLFADMFYAIFNGLKPLPETEVDSLFSTYLTDGAFTLKSTEQGNAFTQLNSMKPVVKYLETHEGIKVCNFKHFKNHILEASTLSEYLKNPDCTVTKVGINGDIPKEAKTCLENAVSKRNGTLKVTYFDS